MAPRRTIDEILEDARATLRRLTPEAAYEAAGDGAVLVDIRSEDERRRQGARIPEAVHHPLSVLAWRLDPAVPTHNPKLDLDTHVILICREGYSSSLAAGWLQAIGFRHASDVIGGIDAWRDAGLPLDPYPYAVREPHPARVRM
jgi:rhodanese-related sulfurtransferase